MGYASLTHGYNLAFARLVSSAPRCTFCDCPPLTPLCHGSASHASHDMASDKATHISQMAQIILFNPINQRESHSPYFRGIRSFCKRHANVLPYTPTIIHGRCFVVLTNLLNQQFDDLTNYIYYSICQKIYHSFKKLPSGSCQCVSFRLFLVYLHYIFLKKFCRAEKLHAINKYIFSKGFFWFSHLV